MLARPERRVDDRFSGCEELRRPAECPLMFDPTADLGHKAMRFVFTVKGHVPKEV